MQERILAPKRFILRVALTNLGNEFIALLRCSMDTF